MRLRRRRAARSRQAHGERQRCAAIFAFFTIFSFACCRRAAATPPLPFAVAAGLPPPAPPLTPLPPFTPRCPPCPPPMRASANAEMRRQRALIYFFAAIVTPLTMFFHACCRRRARRGRRQQVFMPTALMVHVVARSSGAARKR